MSLPDPESARRVAADVVARQLAACAQILGPMASVYTWKGEVHQSDEWLLLFKTTDQSFVELADVVRAAHPYEVPEVVAVPITHALGKYAEWVRKNSDGIDDKELLDG